MDQRVFFRQMIDFNKAAFDHTFQSMVALQDQAERMNRQWMEQAVWLPEDGKKAVNQWLQTVKKGRDKYKKAVDQGFARLQELFSAKP